MSSGGMKEITDFFNQINNDMNKFLKAASDIWKEETSKAADDVYSEFSAYQQQTIQKIFTDAVDEFYSAYTPQMYDRTNGLYEVLSMKTDKRGLVIYGDTDIYDLLDKDKMHRDRKGGDLFQKVFEKGWHGGAESILASKEKKWGSHPSPGTPYYRKPGFINTESGKRVHHRWGSWGRIAVQTKAPYEIMEDNLRAAESSYIFREFERLVNQHGNKAFQNTTRRLQDLEHNMAQ